MSTQHVLSCTSRNGFHWLVGCLLVGLNLLIPACDPFLVSVCRFENLPGCPGHAGQLADGATDLADASPAAPGAPLPLGEPRRFEKRISVDQGTTQRFVGLQGNPRQAVFLATNGTTTRLEVYTLDLDNEQEGQRLGKGTPCLPPYCPAIPGGLDFGQDRLYRTAAEYYYFDYKSKKSIKYGNNWSSTTLCTLGANNLRPFISAQHDYLGVRNNDPQQLCVKSATGKIDNLRFTLGYPAALVIGNIDESDSLPKSLEAIAFNEVNDVASFISPMIDKLNFESIIKGAIEKGSDGASGVIQAAYIHDINQDKRQDLLFVRSGRLRVASYRGRKTDNSLHDFGIWEQDVSDPILGESVQYVVIDNLTNDTYPDLIVETDKHVHFYRNVSM